MDLEKETQMPLPRNTPRNRPKSSDISRSLLLGHKGVFSSYPNPNGPITHGSGKWATVQGKKTRTD